MSSAWRSPIPPLVSWRPCRSGGQGRNRTTDTRIFSPTESAARREQAEDARGLSRGPTEPPRPTEHTPNSNRDSRTVLTDDPCWSTAWAHRDRTFSEPRTEPDVPRCMLGTHRQVMSSGLDSLPLRARTTHTFYVLPAPSNGVRQGAYRLGST